MRFGHSVTRAQLVTQNWGFAANSDEKNRSPAGVETQLVQWVLSNTRNGIF